MTADENAPGFDILSSGEQVQTYLLLCKVPQAVNYVYVSITEKIEICGCDCFLLRANDKFSDNRHVLIDVYASLTETTGGLHQGDKRCK